MKNERKTVALGITDFSDIISRNVFYVDKTYFIKDWYNSAGQVTLITRPRRFGKTLTLSMVETFFSNQYAGSSHLFEGLSVWEDEKFRDLQGKFPVINFSLANVKQKSYESMKTVVRMLLAELFDRHSYLLKSEKLSETEKEEILKFKQERASDEKCMHAFRFLSKCMYEHFGEKVIILIDEYDTPMLEAYTAGYWEEAIEYTRRMFHAAFKDNPYLDRGLMTGVLPYAERIGMGSTNCRRAERGGTTDITRITQESIFSDLNNPRVVTTTVEMYQTCFGFTEKEVFTALEDYDLSERKGEVKYWYDGFQFGSQKEIYNPWSILNFLSEKCLKPYWMNTSGNALVGKLVREGSLKVKDEFETLLGGGTVKTEIDESITFMETARAAEAAPASLTQPFKIASRWAVSAELSGDSKTIWSWFLTTGYVKIVRQIDEKYEISLTNYEVREAMYKLVKKWFSASYDEYTEFIRMLLCGNLEGMQRYMEKVVLYTFSYFDVGSHSSESEQAEQFYHGFTLGLIADLYRTHILTSNREYGNAPSLRSAAERAAHSDALRAGRLCGFGRYDVCIEPLDKSKDGIIIEFKVFESKKEETLEDTVKRALSQIESMNYEADLKARGVRKIQKYGFAFRGKEVLIGKD
ncbi:MAG: ATP-binding protein [Lachnospiraceae bacterium]|nr:ATP-binding protein [Lachnospiraceae bacterium]